MRSGRPLRRPHHTRANLQRRFAVRSNLAHRVTTSLTMGMRAQPDCAACAFDRAFKGWQTPACPSKSGAPAWASGGLHSGAPLRTVRQKLLQRAVDRGELGIELGAQSIDDCDDGQRNAGRNQAILDGRGGCFVLQKSGNEIHADAAPLFRPNEPFWIDNVRASLAALVRRITPSCYRNANHRG